ncbi:hypothetical protein C8R44DRAFT_862910 [Mycena epipterygia]|nr:hypothetical protein C8R44DRAFT_862910 [Mycena epipterygia]
MFEMQDSSNFSIPQTFHLDSSESHSSSEDSTLLIAENPLNRSQASDMQDMPTIEPKGWLQRHLLQAICFALHVVLVLVHITLLISGIKHWEHHFTFALEQQTIVSFWTTTITITTGIIYSSILVFVTQQLAMQHNVHSHQTLTSVHDRISSWAGLGSTLVTLYNQVSVPASVLGTLHVVGYLGCIAVLHTTIPAVLSVETFMATVPVAASTFGIPEFANTTAVQSTRDFMTTFSPAFLEWSGSFELLGLYNSSLYEVLQHTTQGTGQAPVKSIGYNVSCGCLDAEIINIWDGRLNISLSSGDFALPDVISPNQLSVLLDIYANLIVSNVTGGASGEYSIENLGPKTPNSIIIYTTNTVVDSEGHQGSPLVLDEQPLAMLSQIDQLNISVAEIQFLQCSRSLVVQSGTLDNSTLLGSDLWSYILGTYGSLDTTNNIVDEYLMSSLNLNPLSNTSSSSLILKLHDIENALSALSATIFWIGGHMQPDSLSIRFSSPSGFQDPRPGTVPVLAAGITIIQQEMTHVRLNSSLIAISFGLATSLVLLVLCIVFLSVMTEHKHSIEGVGLLHNIWFWRNHPELSHFAKDVKEPTEIRLRRIGLIPFGSDNVTFSDLKTPSTATKRRHKRQRAGNPHASHSMSSLLITHEVQPPSSARGNNLHILCISLHILLVIVHITLLGLAVERKEHNIIFSINLQQKVSFWCKVVTTVFGTAYYSLLVYSTQSLTVTSAVHNYSLLTATHDKLSAWSGIGSAVSTIYKQVALPASFLGILNISLYLLSIAVLHITTPALISVQTFNVSIPSTAETPSIPQWSEASHNSTVMFIQNGGAFLPWMGSLGTSKTIGLYNGSLYDVLTSSYPGSRTAHVSAVGFNITCGSVPEVIAKQLGLMNSWNISFPLEGNNIVIIAPIALAEDSIIVYTQNSVVDSESNTGPQVVLNSNVSLQFIQCSKSLVTQTAQVNIDSRAIIPESLNPIIQKTHSKWQTYDTLPRPANGTTLLASDYWAQIVSQLPQSTLTGDTGAVIVDFGAAYVTQQLGLDPSFGDDSQSAHAIYLHDIENSLSNLVASVFWIGGNVHPTSLALEQDTTPGSSPVQPQPPVLSTGSTTVEQAVSAARLDTSVLAVSIGLGASIVLLILALTFSANAGSPDPYLTSLGFLQVSWVFQNHPQLLEILEQVEDPTDHNLRIAGLVEVRLLDALTSQHNE